MNPQKKFNHESTLISTSRKGLIPKISQYKLSRELGYKNGQFISNVERGLCAIPPSIGSIICEKLDIDPVGLIHAKLQDHEDYLYSLILPKETTNGN